MGRREFISVERLIAYFEAQTLVVHRAALGRNSFRDGRCSELNETARIGLLDCKLQEERGGDGSLVDV
jgi:hypothetical protein